jgi:hypothetical protein
MAGSPNENPFSDWCYQNNREVILSHAALDYARMFSARFNWQSKR